MPTYNPTLQKGRLADVPADVHGLISKKTAELDGVAVTEVTFHPGARWSKDLKAYAGTDLCELPHVAPVPAGTLRVVLRDGSQEDFSAGEVMLLPPRPRRLDGRRPAVHLRRVLQGQRLLQLGQPIAGPGDSAPASGAIPTPRFPGRPGCCTPVQDLLELLADTGAATRCPFVTLEWPRHWSCGQVRKAARSS